jgi:hypothetical protein
MTRSRSSRSSKAASADPVTAYAEAVLAGRSPNGRPVGRLERLACERHLRDLDRRRKDWRPEVAAA